MTAGAPARFVHLAVTTAPQAGTLLFAVDADGGVWQYNQSKKRWIRLPDQRDGEVAAAPAP